MLGSAVLLAALMVSGGGALSVQTANVDDGKALLGGNGAGATTVSDAVARIELDLTNLELAHNQQGKLVTGIKHEWPAVPLLQATLANGKEVACINCDEQLFVRWVSDQKLGSEANHLQSDCVTPTPSPLSLPASQQKDKNGKHPNAPGYGRWANVNKSNLLSAKRNIDHGKAAVPSKTLPCGVTASYLHTAQLEAMKPRLHQLWAERRLVVGHGPNPLHQRMGFLDVLMQLARSSPFLTNQDCSGQNVPHCGTLISGLKPAASITQLHHDLSTTFGQEFLDAHKFDPTRDAHEQHRRVQALLAALKHSFSFYRQGCLFTSKSTNGSVECDLHKPTDVIGQIACNPETDTVADDCMYAELRRCTSCGAAHFFEYARFHGPLALFGTRHKRDWVMGQCEEFSRAGYALLASLGWEARYVLDFTDHVWIEVKLPHRDTGTMGWVHADPSEGVLGSPLMYENGWGKQLTMIFAFTPWKVEHVTQTYTAKYSETVLRRGIPEDLLHDVVQAANKRLQYELPIESWGYAAISKNRSLEEVSLWSHFQAH